MNAFGNQAANSHPTFDDFYVAVGAGARARVEIGNKPNYADCTELAITTPTHWTDTEIRTTIRQGLFDEGQTAYLFVVTANGVVSQGRAIKIGTSPLPTLTISDPAVREGDAGTSNVVFTVTLSAPSEDTVMVDFATEDYTAKRGTDYVHRDNALTFNPGETKKTVSVRVIGDLLDEPNEKIRLNLSNASGAVIGDRRGVATIHDNDPAPTLTINDVTVVEGNSGTVPARFIVTLSAASGRTVTVKYASANGTAASPADYYAKALAMLTFLPGQTTKTVAVWVRGDTLVESRETFFLNLSSAVNATIADTRGIGAILDDDDPSS
jgi:hypothetical protein